ncbi:MAG: sigma-70 family RNA polymerase sigma factor [Candidatus Krumholzibacteriia bacterium]
MSYVAPAEFGTPAFLTRLQAQDRDAIQQVVHEFLPQILRAARGAGLSEHEADDVTQQTFLTFIEGLPRFEGRSQVRTWLFGILYHKLREARRGFQKQNRHDDIDQVLESRFDARGMWQSPPREADHDLWDQQIRDHLEECLQTLPERHRLAFLLKEVEGLATHEICNALEVTATNLGVILYRARNRLRECLEGRGFAER